MNKAGLWMGLGALAIAAGAVAACSTDDDGTATSTLDGGADGFEPLIPDPQVDGGSTEVTATECDVLAIIENRCSACHDGTRAGVPRFSTYEELVAKSKRDPTKTVAQLVVQRTKDKSMPPPSGGMGGPEDDEIATFEAWLAAGTPKSPKACSETVDGGPLVMADGGAFADGGATCVSGKYWDAGPDGSAVPRTALMFPGGDCNGCHQERAPRVNLRVAGTVYSAPREPDNCNGKAPPPPIQVIITAADGKETTHEVNAAGNFLQEKGKLPATPFKARVVQGGKTRVMVGAQKNLNCNSCHTAAGKNGAPGRILAPE